MQTVFEPQAMQALARAHRARGERVGFVPTMGFLHRGHTSLMDIARARCDWLVASIFVNPMQFAEGEDLDRYPSDPEGDARACETHGVDLLFIPSALYEPDHSTVIHVGGVTDGLCGASRPRHFDGVTTVVARLFGIVQPTVAVFGEKDYQQLATIRRMSRDLAMGVEIVGGPLVRDDDGLALSSRNTYLSPANRRRALSLHRALQHVRDQAGAGTRDIGVLLEQGRAMLDIDNLDYLELRDAQTLQPIHEVRAPARVLVAAHVGPTRLIDNMAVLP